MRKAKKKTNCIALIATIAAAVAAVAGAVCLIVRYKDELAELHARCPDRRNTTILQTWTKLKTERTHPRPCIVMAADVLFIRSAAQRRQRAHR